MDPSKLGTLLESTLNPWLMVGIGYFLGALPFAVWIGQLAGQDPRKKGSKNPGTSNVTRLIGWKWGLTTLFFDLGKGLVVALLGLSWGKEWAALCAFIAILGHCTSPFLGFRGGRGVATTLGGLAVLHIGLMWICMFQWVVILFFTRKAAWASLLMAAILVIGSQASDVDDPTRFFCMGAMGLILIRHWDHMKGIL